MLEQDCLTWSQRMKPCSKVSGENGQSGGWRLCRQLDPDAPADEQQLAAIAQAYTRLSSPLQSGRFSLLSSPVVLCCRGYGRRTRLQFFPFITDLMPDPSRLAKAAKAVFSGMLRDRYQYYCDHVVIKGFYKHYFQHFDRQIVLVDCLTPLNSGPAGIYGYASGADPADAELPLRQTHIIAPPVFPCIDKLLFPPPAKRTMSPPTSTPISWHCFSN